MALTERLALIVDLDAKSAVRGLQSIEKTADKSLTGTTEKADRMSAGFRKAGAFMLSAGGLMAAGLFRAAGAAEEAAKVSRQTEAALASMGGAANVTADDVADLASELSKKSGIDDEVIQSGENLLLTFGKIRNEVGEGNDIFDRATESALDMSVALGTDMNSAAVQLGKALNDPIKGLTAMTRSGVSFTQQQKDQVKAMVESGDVLGAQVLILNEIEKQFSGSAEAQATGTMKMQVAVGNLEEAIGAGLAPAVQGLAENVTKGIEGFVAFNDATGGLGGKIAVATTGFLLFGGAVSIAIGYAKNLKVALLAIKSGAGSAVTAIGKFGPMAAVVGGLTFASLKLRDSFDQNKHAVEEFAEASAAANDEMLLDLFVENIVANGGKVTDTFEEIAQGSFASAERIRDAFANAGNDTAKFDSILTDVATSAKAVEGDAEKSGDAIDRWAGAAGDGTGPGEGFATAVGRVGEAAADGTEKVLTHAEAIGEFNDALKATFDPLFGALDATNDLATAQLEAAAAEKEFGRGSLEAIAANQKLAEAALDNQAAQNELAAAVEDGRVSFDDAVGTLQGWVAQGVITQQAADEQIYRFGALDGLVRYLPKDVKINVNAPGLDGIIARIQILDGKISERRTLNIGGGVRVAHGGGVVPGPLGAERLIVAQAGETILPVRPGGQSIGMNPLPSGAAGGHVTNVTIYNAVPETAVQSLTRVARQAAVALSST